MTGSAFSPAKTGTKQSHFGGKIYVTDAGTTDE